jgi:O-antigen/teichoic acid export membrane protein
MTIDEGAVPVDPEVSGGRVTRNTVTNGADRLVGAGLAVLLTPFLLHRLGDEQYGIWVLALTLTFAGGYLSLADLGLQQASVRLIAEARSRRDAREISEIASVTFYVYLALGIVLAILIASLAGTIADVFDVAAGAQHTATLVFLLVGLQIGFDLPAAGLLAVVEGAQRYGLLRLIDVVGRVLWAGLIVLLVVQGHGVVALAGVSLALAVLDMGAAVWAAKRTNPELHLSLRLVHRGSLRRIVHSSTGVMGLRILATVYSQMDRIIVGTVLSVAAVARYEVAYKIHSLAAITLGVAPSAVLPVAAYLNAATDRARLRELYLRGTRYSVVLCVPLCVAGIIYTRAILATWVGDQYLDMTAATRLFLLYPALAIALVVGQTMLVGLGRMRRMLAFHAGAVTVNLVVSIVLARRLGVIGVVWGTVSAYLALWVPFTRLLLREFEVNVGTWVRRVLWPIVPVIAAQVVVGLATLRWVEGFSSLWQVGMAFTGNYIIALIVFCAIGGRDETAQIARMLGRRRVVPTKAPS